MGKRRGWTEEELKIATKMKNDGFSYAEISRSIKKDPSNVRNKLINIGVSKTNKKYNKNHKYAIGDIVKDCEVIEQIRMTDKNLKGYLLKCLIHQEIFKYIENTLDSKQTKGSPFKSGHRVCDSNSLKNKKHVLKYLKNINDAEKFTYKSSEHIDCVCPSCGLERKTIIRDLVEKGFYCRICDKNVSMSERTFLSMCLENNIKVTPQKKYYGFMTENKKYYFYDFYIEETNTCVELMGEQHYYTSDSSIWEDSKDIQKRDVIKKDYCNKNNINYIAIDCRESDYNYIIDNILNSRIGKMFNNVDREKIIITALEIKHSDDVKLLIKDFENGMSYIRLMKKYDLGRHEIVRILKRSGNYKKRNTARRVKCLETGNVFESLTDAAETMNTYTASISNACSPNHKQKTAGRCHWEYVD